MKHKAFIAVILISGTTLVGWWMDHAVLTAWLPGVAGMTFNTALCLLLIATASLFPDEPSHSQMVRLSVGALVALFAVLSLLQDMLGADFGIDRLFYDARGGAEMTSPHPGRMSPVTALGFLFSGCALILLARLKQSSHFATITHALMLLTAQVALLGIGLNLFMHGTLTAYAHFSSISLLTAISFLLLSAGFIGIFKRRCPGGKSNPVLYSGIRLMYKLSYPGKFALISMIIAVPLAVLMWNQFHLLQRHVADTKLKIIGIEHIRETSKLLAAIQEHRGMTNANLANPETFNTAIKIKMAEIDRMFAENAAIDRLHAAAIKVPDTWQSVLDQWSTIKTNHQDAMLLWRLHTVIAALITTHLRDVGNETRLAYDTDPGVHNFINILLDALPDLLEQIGQLRGQGAGFMAKKEIFHQEQIKLEAIAGQISLLHHKVSQQMHPGLSAGKNKALEAAYHAFSSASNAFVATVEQQLIRQKQFSVSAEGYFALATSAIREGHAFARASMSHVAQRLDERIAKNITRQHTIILTALLVVLFIFFLFAAFYQSVMMTIRALDNEAECIRHGSMHEHMRLPASDKLSASFSTVADELARVSSHMRAVVDHAGEGIITIDGKGVIQSFNPAAEDIFGYTHVEALGKNITMLIPEHRRRHHSDGLRHYLETGESAVIAARKPIEVHGLNKDGLEFPLEIAISAVTLGGKKMFVSILRDVSERKMLESRVLHAQRMEAVGGLVGGVAHHFNNMLAGIVGKAYMARMKSKGNPEAIAYLESIESISQRAGDMVAQLLIFAHKDFFGSKQDTSLSGLVKGMFKAARLTIGEDIELSLNIAGPDLMVHCDASQIQQVLMDMLNNARDAVADSSVKRIDVGLKIHTPDSAFFDRHPELAAGEYACLSISDTGHGMSAETMTQIFEPFYTTREVGKGTGLGLSTAYGAVTSSDGMIEVDSVVGKGTAFHIYLPLIAVEHAEAAGDSGTSIVHGSNRETLLLVDDEPLVIESTQGVLEELGYRVITASTGVEGLAQYVKHQDSIDAIITDVVMPKMGGVEMFREIRKLNAGIPMLFITGHDQGNVQLRAGERENVSVISKPVQISRLSQVIREML